MKKIIFSFAFILVLALCTATALAETEDVRFSEDFGKMYIGDESFTMRDTSALSYNYEDYKIDVEPTDEQRALIGKTEVWLSENRLTATAYIYYNSGAYLSIPYVNDEIIDAYDTLGSENGIYTIDFIWPDGNKVNVDKSLLYGERTVMDIDNSMYSTYYVTVTSKDADLVITKGLLINMDGVFYYADYEENNVFDIYDFEYGYITDAILYRITDEVLSERLLDAHNDYRGDIEIPSSITAVPSFKSFGNVFIIALLGVLPAVLLALCLVAAIRTRKTYRRLYTAACVFLGAELAVFVAVMILIFQYN